jgi:hypothetical protein
LIYFLINIYITINYFPENFGKYPLRATFIMVFLLLLSALFFYRAYQLKR